MRVLYVYIYIYIFFFFHPVVFFDGSSRCEELLEQYIYIYIYS
jgi:hypothetical protein